ncbi:MAG: HNH endonuclease signature motif containing protein [Candidatus Peregrinibacteria bacterium]|nr:HNH endonuclease signature motif containing protein [Candidatus Peregrinibacteria bacterium]
MPTMHTLSSTLSPAQPSQSPALPAALTDKDLYRLCQLYGGNAKTWLRKFAGLLPEVFKRSLHLRHGCGSIGEFAKKLSGMNERTVKKILNLHERLADKPYLLALFESGEQGWSKLEAVAFIATQENEKDLSNKVKTLPFRALVLCVKNIREKLTGAGQFQIQNNSQNLQDPLSSGEFHDLQGSAMRLLDAQQTLESTNQDTPVALPPNQQPFLSHTLQTALSSSTKSSAITTNIATEFGHDFKSQYETFTTFSFPISAHSRQKLNLIKTTLEKQQKKTLTWNQIIALWPASTPTNPSSTFPPIPLCVRSKIKLQATRHIPAQIRRLILATHGHLCVFPNCNNAYAEFHHVKPYAIYKNHDPSHIYPICKTHHALFHAGLIANLEKSPKFWFIRTHARQTSIDKKAMKFKI